MRHTMAHSMKAHRKLQGITTSVTNTWTDQDYEKAKADGYRLSFDRGGYSLAPFEGKSTPGNTGLESQVDVINLVLTKSETCPTAARALALATQ